jgi:hypothetical protein
VFLPVLHYLLFHTFAFIISFFFSASLPIIFICFLSFPSFLLYFRFSFHLCLSFVFSYSFLLQVYILLYFFILFLYFSSSWRPKGYYMYTVSLADSEYQDPLKSQFRMSLGRTKDCCWRPQEIVFILITASRHLKWCIGSVFLFIIHRTLTLSHI